MIVPNHQIEKMIRLNSLMSFDKDKADISMEEAINNIGKDFIYLTAGKEICLPKSCENEPVVFDDSSDYLQTLYTRIEIKNDAIYFRHGDYIAVKAREYINLSSILSASMYINNSLSVLGFVLTDTKSIAPGFSGNPLIEIINLGKNSVKIPYKSKIACLKFHYLDSSAQ